jgi:hypothetical protein
VPRPPLGIPRTPQTPETPESPETPETPETPEIVEHVVDLPCTPAEALRAAQAAALDWGAELDPHAGDGEAGAGGGELRLPVVAGLRRGLLRGPLAIAAAAGGSRVVFVPAAKDYYVETSAVALLLVAAAGGLLTVLWPLYPKLMPAAPLGAVFALSGWFLVASRQRAKGPAEFMRSIAAHCGAAARSGLDAAEDPEISGNP